MYLFKTMLRKNQIIRFACAYIKPFSIAVVQSRWVNKRSAGVLYLFYENYTARGRRQIGSPLLAEVPPNRLDAESRRMEANFAGLHPLKSLLVR